MFKLKDGIYQEALEVWFYFLAAAAAAAASVVVDTVTADSTAVATAVIASIGVFDEA